MKKIFIIITLLTLFLDGAETRRVLITGCARSGTHFTSLFFELSGFDVPHEKMGTFGSVSWLMNVDDTHCPWGHARKGVKFDHIFHQVRHPLKSISSIYFMEPQKTWDYVMRHVEDIYPEDSQIVKAAKYWLYWNEKAQKQAEFTYRVEDFAEVIPRMSAILNIPLDPGLYYRMPHDVYHYSIYYFSWEELRIQLPSWLYKKVRKLANRYGYL